MEVRQGTVHQVCTYSTAVGDYVVGLAPFFLKKVREYPGVPYGTFFTRFGRAETYSTKYKAYYITVLVQVHRSLKTYKLLYACNNNILKW